MSSFWENTERVCVEAEDFSKIDPYEPTGINPFEVDVLSYEDIRFILTTRTIGRIFIALRDFEEYSAALGGRSAIDGCIHASMALEIATLHAISWNRGVTIKGIPPLQDVLYEQTPDSAPDDPGDYMFDATVGSSIFAEYDRARQTDKVSSTGSLLSELQTFFRAMSSGGPQQPPRLDGLAVGQGLPTIDVFFGQNVDGMEIKDGRLEYIGNVNEAEGGKHPIMNGTVLWYILMSYVGLSGSESWSPRTAISTLLKLSNLTGTFVPYVLHSDRVIQLGACIGMIVNTIYGRSGAEFEVPVDILKKGKDSNAGREGLKKFFEHLSGTVQSAYQSAQMDAMEYSRFSPLYVTYHRFPTLQGMLPSVAVKRFQPNKDNDPVYMWMLKSYLFGTSDKAFPSHVITSTFSAGGAYDEIKTTAMEALFNRGPSTGSIAERASKVINEFPLVTKENVEATAQKTMEFIKTYVMFGDGAERYYKSVATKCALMGDDLDTCLDAIAEAANDPSFRDSKTYWAASLLSLQKNRTWMFPGAAVSLGMIAFAFRNGMSNFAKARNQAFAWYGEWIDAGDVDGVRGMRLPGTSAERTSLARKRDAMNRCVDKVLQSDTDQPGNAFRWVWQQRRPFGAIVVTTNTLAIRRKEAINQKVHEIRAAAEGHKPNAHNGTWTLHDPEFDRTRAINARPLVEQMKTWDLAIGKMLTLHHLTSADCKQQDADGGGGGGGGGGGRRARSPARAQRVMGSSMVDDVIAQFKLRKGL